MGDANFLTVVKRI